MLERRPVREWLGSLRRIEVVGFCLAYLAIEKLDDPESDGFCFRLDLSCLHFVLADRPPLRVSFPSLASKVGKLPCRSMAPVNRPRIKDRKEQEEKSERYSGNEAQAAQP